MQKDISENMTTLNDTVENNNELMDYIINYVGQETQPENDEVTTGMVIDVLAEKFPQLVLCLSEENWARGYQQALTDVQEGERILMKYLKKTSLNELILTVSE